MESNQMSLRISKPRDPVALAAVDGYVPDSAVKRPGHPPCPLELTAPLIGTPPVDATVTVFRSRRRLSSAESMGPLLYTRFKGAPGVQSRRRFQSIACAENPAWARARSRWRS